METGILFTKISRKKEKIIVGLVSLVGLTIIGIYAANLEEHTFFSFYICPIITTIITTIGYYVCLD